VGSNRIKQYSTYDEGGLYPAMIYALSAKIHAEIFEALKEPRSSSMSIKQVEKTYDH
jgi:gamma-glutamylcyclotransferase (GGCT)/AIG2-like uncharacterized protein YtfP